MEIFKLSLLLLTCYLLPHYVAAMPDGPPARACTSLRPEHPETEQTGPSLVQLDGIGAMYEPGNTFQCEYT